MKTYRAKIKFNDEKHSPVNRNETRISNIITFIQYAIGHS